MELFPTPPDQRLVATRAKMMIWHRKLSQKQVAIEMEITDSYLSDLLLGKRTWKRELAERFDNAVKNSQPT